VASVTAKKGVMPVGTVFAVTLAFIGVAGCNQKQNTAKILIDSFCFWFLPGTKGRKRACALAKKPASI